MTFDLLPLRFRYTAREPILFPPGKPGNILRGALGEKLRHTAPGLFAPRATDGPSGLGDSPRPFVIRAAHLDGLTLAPGTSFHFDVHLFDLRSDAAGLLTNAFRDLAQDGFGPGRGRAAFECAEIPPEPLRLPLDPVPGGVLRLAIDFLTPTELKPVNSPEFPVVFARARDRVSALRALYGEGPLMVDFRQLGRQAGGVRMLGSEIRAVSLQRRSSRTLQTHPIGGFTGTAGYEGHLDPFLPILSAAAWTGIGRHTVWGNGAIRLRVQG